MSDGTWHDLHLARKYNQPFAPLFHRVPLNNLIDLAFGLADWDPSSAPCPIIRGAQSSYITLPFTLRGAQEHSSSSWE